MKFYYIKKLKTPLIIYTLIAIINYIFNQQGLVNNVFGIDVYMDSFYSAMKLWMKLIIISIGVINLTKFQSREQLLQNLTKIFGFVKLFKQNPKKISQQILLMIVFMQEIIANLKQNKKIEDDSATKNIDKFEKIEDESATKKNEEKQKLNIIDKFIVKINESMIICEEYYNNHKSNYHLDMKPIKFSKLRNILEVSFLCMIIFIIFFQFYLLFNYL